MKDLYHNVLATQHLSPVNSTAVKTSTTIDLQGYNSASVLFAIGQAGDTLATGTLYWTLKLQHSDDDSTYTDTASTDVLNSALTVVIDSSTKDRTVYAFGYKGSKRYVKAVATPTGAHTNGTPIGIIALRGNASYKPVAL